ARRAVLHARPLEHAADDGGRRVGGLLAADPVRPDDAGLPEPRLGAGDVAVTGPSNMQPPTPDTQSDRQERPRRGAQRANPETVAVVVIQYPLDSLVYSCSHS